MNRVSSEFLSFPPPGMFKQLTSAVLLFLALFAFPFTALASSFAITYHFDSSLSGKTRYYDGNNIEFTLRSSASLGGSSDYFVVKLLRDHWFYSEYVGSGLAPRNGTATIRWSGVGPGNYSSLFVKHIDGIWVEGTGTFRNY